MIVSAVASGLQESDDLDWKQDLPSFVRTPGRWNELCKDVAAMANTRGGLLVYGVSDQVELVGIDLAKANTEQILATVHSGIQPYISGVDVIRLPAPGGEGPDVLVIDVPPSEMAPHFQYGWEQKDKGRVTFNAPYRIGDTSAYMSEHHVARAYQERFARQSAADALLKERLAEATETVLSESEDRHAWLVIAARLTRPVPRLVPAPTRSEATAVLRRVIATAARIRDGFDGSAVLREYLAQDVRVGLRRWTESTFLIPEYRTSSRAVMVELHHDGSVVVAADLSTRLEIDSGIPVDTSVVRTLAREAVCAADAHRLDRAADTTVEITATVATAGTEQRLVPYGDGYGSPQPVETTRRPKRLMPASTELAPNADDQALRDCAKELAEGLLHQFGINR
ncbi:AlbA family DNA-binding domain-containing protein [Streptomyces lasiicapitis]|nr:ATP-binding protein [Streptomyces lasiicapitis]